MIQKIDKQIEGLDDQKSVVKFEFANNEYIVLYKSGADFWNATMRSALFLKFWLKVGMRMNLTHDKYYKLEYRPYLAIHRNGLQELLGNLIKTKCKKIRLSEEVIVFQMPQVFDRSRLTSGIRV